MHKIKLTGSSSLLPDNRNWLRLKKELNLHFAEYGDWYNEILNDKSDIISITIFLEDFIDLKDIKISTIKKRLNAFFDILKLRLNKENNYILLSYFYNNDENQLTSAKELSLKEKINYWFIECSYSLIKKYNNLYFINLTKEFSKIGLDSCIDKRNWYLAHSYLSSKGIEILSDSLINISKRIFETSSKVLVVDCDNTLWGGVVGEDGIENLQIGQDGEGKIFEDFQLSIKNLIKKGIIFAILSKNNEKDVWEVFNKLDSMKLKKKDIITWKINWDEKYKNIKELSNELGLSLDSFVFWDDNPIERDQMKKFSPEVFTVDVPGEIYLWPDYLKNLNELIKFKVTDEDKKKKSQYSARAKFIREKDTYEDKKLYLKSINLISKRIEVNQSNINRAEQMNLKTNQYNLRTKRYSAQEIKKFNKKDDKYSFLGSLKDVYGDHGIVGSVYLEKIDDNTIFLDNLLMSCRVIGRHYESWLLSQAVKLYKKKYKYIIGQYIPTEKNIVVKNFFLEHNFKSLNKLDKQYDIDYNKLFNKYGKKNLFIAKLHQVKIANAKLYK